MAGNIIGVIAQRLVRKLCAQCKAPYVPDSATRRLLGVGVDDERPIYQAVGCARCDNVGYKGRVAIMELFKLDAEIDELHRPARHGPRDPHGGRGQGLPHARRRRHLARAAGADQPGGDLARGRPHRPRDLRGRPPWRSSPTAPSTPTGASPTATSTRSTRSTWSCVCKRLGLDLVTFDAVKRSTARADAPRHAHRADRLLLPPLAAAEGGRATSSRRSRTCATPWTTPASAR